MADYPTTIRELFAARVMEEREIHEARDVCAYQDRSWMERIRLQSWKYVATNSAVEDAEIYLQIAAFCFAAIEELDKKEDLREFWEKTREEREKERENHETRLTSPPRPYLG